MKKEEYKKSTINKAKILSTGFRITQEAEELITDSVKEEHRGYDNSHWGVSKDQKIPAEIFLPGEIVVATHIRPDSPLTLTADKQKNLILLENNKKISDVSYLKRPKIWSLNTSTGTNMKKIANFYGAHCLNFNIYSGCQFWDAKLPCKFCSVQPTQNSFNEVEIKKNVNDIQETAKKAFEIEDKIDFCIFTGGSYLNGDEEFDKMIPALKAVQEVLPKSWNKKIKGNVAIMAPQTFEKIDQLMDTGIEHPSFNLEVWTKRYFNYICPGKAKYRGLDHIQKAFDYAVSNYGRGVFWVNFVGGLNSLETLKEGFSFMAKKGVVPGANVFHPDVGSIVGSKRKGPSTEYVISLFQHAAKLYHEYDYQPFFDQSCLRNSIANEAYLGYI